MEYFYFIFLIFISSFIKCVVDSKIDKSFFYRRSCCENCKTILKIYDLIPIFSYLFLKGHCRYCNFKIHISVFLYEFFAFAIALFYLLTKDIFIFIDYFDYFIVLILVYISIEDVITYEINQKLQILLLSIIMLKLFFVSNSIRVLDVVILVVIYNLIYLVLKKGIGYGDIKLYCILAVSLNLVEGINLFLYTFIYAGFFAIFLLLIKKVTRNTKVALAPFICLAYITVLLFREFII